MQRDASQAHAQGEASGVIRVLDRPADVSRETRKRAQHAAALRRARKRAKQGVMVVSVTPDPGHTAKLARLRYLGEHEVEDRRAVADAIIGMIDGIEIGEP
jgi:hypothetical protein